MANYGDIARMVEAAERIARGREGLDSDLLFLLAVFSGQEKWISRMGHRSRTEIFLTSTGVPPRTIQRLFRGLDRFETQPVSAEEQIVHDAVLLDAMGAYGIARLLAAGYSERMDISEMAAAIEEAAQAPMRTKEGEAMALDRRELMRHFARRLREEHAQFGRLGVPQKERPRLPGAVEKS